MRDKLNNAKPLIKLLKQAKVYQIYLSDYKKHYLVDPHCIRNLTLTYKFRFV